MDPTQLLLARSGRSGDHMDWNDGSWWWMAALMTVLVVIVVGAVVWAIVSTAKPRAPDSPPPAAPPPAAPGHGASSARAILDERLARGEIDVAEYEQRRRALE